MNLLAQLVLLAASIMFTPISDDALLATFLLSTLNQHPVLIIWGTTWITCTLAFSWFYVVGRWLRRLFPNRFTKQKAFQKADTLLSTYGARVLLVSYFLPGARHPIHYIAGFNQMPFRLYQRYNILSAALYSGAWTLALTYLRETPWVEAILLFLKTR